MNCLKCGSPLAPGAKFCLKCGQPVVNSESVKSNPVPGIPKPSMPQLGKPMPGQPRPIMPQPGKPIPGQSRPTIPQPGKPISSQPRPVMPRPGVFQPGEQKGWFTNSVRAVANAVTGGALNRQIEK